MAAADDYIKVGRVRLTPGVKKGHMRTYYASALFAIMLLTFMPQVQPFILSETLGIPESQQGVVSGNLAFYGEIVIIFTIGALGALSDKIGRKTIYSAGFFLLAIGMFLYPTAASVGQLIGYRLIFALGSAAVTAMLATVVADYAIDADRGRASGFQGVMNGLGAMITVLFFLRLPQIFVGMGLAPVSAGRMSYWVGGSIAMFAAILMFVGLQNRTTAQKSNRRPFSAIIREGIDAAKDPGIALAYGAAFVSRGDLAIVGTFLALWIANHGTENLGMTRADALARAGIFVAIAQGFALLGAPIFGILSDKINRVNALIIAVSISAIGYLSTLFVTDPMGPSMIVSAILIGLGEISGVIASGVLIAQQAEREIRGSVIGVFSFCGALGILVATKVGGLLFDGWREAGPFALFGLLSVFVVIWGFAVRNKVVPVNVSAESIH